MSTKLPTTGQQITDGKNWGQIINSILTNVTNAREGAGSVTGKTVIKLMNASPDAQAGVITANDFVPNSLNIVGVGTKADGSDRKVDFFGSTQFRNNLQVDGALSVGAFYSVNGITPTNGVMRLTPNLHLNSGPKSTIWINWDSGAVPAADAANLPSFGVGNGAGGALMSVNYAGQGSFSSLAGGAGDKIIVANQNGTIIPTGDTLSGLKAAIAAGKDNLGNHTATTTLNMNGQAINSASNITNTALGGSGNQLVGTNANGTLIKSNVSMTPVASAAHWDGTYSYNALGPLAATNGLVIVRRAIVADQANSLTPAGIAAVRATASKLTAQGAANTPSIPKAATNNAQAALELIAPTGNAAYIAFHKPGAFGANFGLDGDNNFAFGGWSAGDNYIGVKTGWLMANRLDPLGEKGGAIQNIGTFGGVIGGNGQRLEIYNQRRTDGKDWQETTLIMQKYVDNSPMNYIGFYNGYTQLGGTARVDIQAQLTVGGAITTVNNITPTGGVIRLTPNLHLNSGPGAAVYINHDSGAGAPTNPAFVVGNGQANANLLTINYAGDLSTGYLTSNKLKAAAGSFMMIASDTNGTIVPMGTVVSATGNGNYKHLGAWDKLDGGILVYRAFTADSAGVANSLSAAGLQQVKAATGGGADNLGNHTATTALNMGAHGITSAAGVIRDGNGGWVRTYGATGWFNGTHGGGMYMEDATYVKTYGGKSLFTSADLVVERNTYMGGILQVGGGSQGSKVNIVGASTDSVSKQNQGNSQLELRSAAGGQAVNIAFHRVGQFGANFGLDVDNYFSTQGWSSGAGFTGLKVGTLVAHANIHNSGGYVYPGRADSNGAMQGAWYLGSHGSYGLFTNTGFYAAGGMHSGGAINTINSITPTNGAIRLTPNLHLNSGPKSTIWINWDSGAVPAADAANLPSFGVGNGAGGALMSVNYAGQGSFSSLAGGAGDKIIVANQNGTIIPTGDTLSGLKGGIAAAQNAANGAQNTASGANSKADGAQNTANQAMAKANEAMAKANSIQPFNAQFLIDRINELNNRLVAADSDIYSQLGNLSNRINDAVRLIQNK